MFETSHHWTAPAWRGTATCCAYTRFAIARPAQVEQSFQSFWAGFRRVSWLRTGGSSSLLVGAVAVLAHRAGVTVAIELGWDQAYTLLTVPRICGEADNSYWYTVIFVDRAGAPACLTRNNTPRLFRPLPAQDDDDLEDLSYVRYVLRQRVVSTQWAGPVG